MRNQVNPCKIRLGIEWKRDYLVDQSQCSEDIKDYVGKLGKNGDFSFPVVEVKAWQSTF